jgi:pimeloyl-ACP methyl ester carboxylesterase
MPGFGRADKPDDFDHTVTGHARHFDAALTALGVERAHLVLHDFGGGPGLAWAASHTDRCASITLVAAGITPAGGSSAVGFRRLPPLADLLETMGSRGAFELLMRAHGPLPRAWLDRMFADRDRETRRAVVAIQKAMQDPPPTRPMAWTIAAAGIPVLIMWGGHDRVTPLLMAYAQKQLFPQARVEVLEHSGHWPFADDPDGVAQRVLPFLERHAGAAAAVA